VNLGTLDGITFERQWILTVNCLVGRTSALGQQRRTTSLDLRRIGRIAPKPDPVQRKRVRATMASFLSSKGDWLLAEMVMATQCGMSTDAYAELVSDGSPPRVIRGLMDPDLV
jgi:hypothetical protein